MIADFGWKHLYIDFQPLKDIENQPDSIVFTSKIKSDLGIMDNSILLIFSKDSFATHRDTLLFKPTGTESDYKAVLKTGISNGKYAYFLTAKDTTGRKYTAPYNYPDSLFEFNLGPDQEKPVITYRPVKYLLGSLRNFDVAAKVTDNLGVDTVSVIFYRNGSEFYKSQLTKRENDIYAGEISSQLFNPQNSDLINYCLVATDRSKARNLRRVPETGTFTLPVFTIGNPVTEYANDFETKQADFVLTDFVVSKESGFDNFALNTPHPYPSPEMDNDSL